MKILVVGYGSMGRRRIRLLKHASSEHCFICVDNNKKRYDEIKSDGLPAFSDLDSAISEEPDIAFVCTSPGNHAEIILRLIENRIPVFTELNLLSDRYDEIIKSAEKNKVKIFMSNTMLYDKQIIAIMESVQKKRETLSYIYHVGQYLPDWHPWESYRDFFVSNKKTNGCREILAIQLPWIIELFGNVRNKTVISKKNTRLDIEYDDTYIITFEHCSGDIGVMICDVIARKAVNYLEIMGEHTHIIWGGTPESLLEYDEESGKMKLLRSYESTEHMEGYADIIKEDPYIDEINAFLSYIEIDKTPDYSLEKDKYILDLIDEIEGSN